MAAKGAKIRLSYREKLHGSDKDAAARYEAKLKLLDITVCPYEDKKGWTDDIKQWPSVTYPDLFNYLTEMPGQFTRSAMKAYKSLESYTYFEDGYVSHIDSKSLSGKRVLMKCIVNHGQKTTEPPCNTWIAVNTEGSVLASHCDCMAG